MWGGAPAGRSDGKAPGRRGKEKEGAGTQTGAPTIRPVTMLHKSVTSARSTIAIRKYWTQYAREKGITQNTERHRLLQIMSAAHAAIESDRDSKIVAKILIENAREILTGQWKSPKER